jgi:predicted lipoprotein
MFITYSTSVLRLFLLSFLLISCGHKNSSTEFVQATSTQVIAVAYKDLYQQADALYENSTSCLLSTTDYVVVLEQLKPQWMRAWAAWQSVQWVQFGPIKQDGREWALQFWPDKKT